MAKSSNTERAKRVNAALELLKDHGTPTGAVAAMADRYQISKRQAYRYIHEAQKIGDKVPIPDSKITFTVKLSPKLIQKTRDYAKVSGHTISDIVTRALEIYLYKGRKRGC
jgi:predicted DNA-binding transcriptional regulator YafY